jgi:hypothetical protein
LVELGDKYFSRLRRSIDDGGNLAVKLGPESGDLGAIDIDDDAEVEPLLAAHPESRKTFQRRGSKGCQFFYHVIGPYPKEVRIITVNGKRIGEWRGGRCISMIWGVHPKGMRYEWINTEPVIDLRYDSLIRPDGWAVETKKGTEKRSGPTNDPNQGASNKRNGYGSRKIAWGRFNEMIEAEDGGIVDALVEGYFLGAVWKDEDGGRWQCANLSGKAPTYRGSFTIKRNGWCTEWDGSWPGEKGTGIVNVITSEERASASGQRRIMIEEVFTFLKEKCGEDFFTLTLPVLYLPVPGATPQRDCNERFYKGCAATAEYFSRDGQLVYIKRDPELGVVLCTLTRDSLRAEIERVFELRKKDFDTKDKRWKAQPALCNSSEAQAILGDDRSRDHNSLPLRLLAASPVLIERNGQPVTLGKGYHPDAGGIYVCNDLVIPTMSVDKARNVVLDVFADYHWVSPSDLSRAIAQLISPALKLGSLLGPAIFPLDAALGDQSQCGKTHRMKIITAIYGETAYTIIKTQRGVGSFEESISAALLSGKLFCTIDNARGDFQSQMLESVLN